MTDFDGIFTFHKNSTTAINGNELEIEPTMNAATVYVTGDTTGHTCYFEGMDMDGNWYPAMCSNKSTLKMGISTTGINEPWDVILSGWQKFRVRIGNITTTGSGLTIRAKVVD